VETFAEKYPHCLPATEVDLSTASAELLAMVDWLGFLETAEIPVK